jgi:hypothetical protein
MTADSLRVLVSDYFLNRAAAFDLDADKLVVEYVLRGGFVNFSYRIRDTRHAYWAVQPELVPAEEAFGGWQRRSTTGAVKLMSRRNAPQAAAGGRRTGCTAIMVDELAMRTEQNQGVEAALRWIADILNARNVPFQIVGGLAARAYGATRQINDIDLYAPASELRSVLELIAPFVTRPLAHYHDQHWDLVFMRLEYGGQPIEIAVGDDAKYRDSRLGEWHDAAVDYAASERLNVLGVDVPVIPRHQLLSYKRRLDRAIDRVDVEEITGG